MIAATVTFYSTVVFVHVMAVVVGLGPTFAYPVFWRAAKARFPRSMPYLLATMERFGKTVIGPAAVLVLLTGLYLVISEDGGYDFSPDFVKVGMPVVVALILLGPLYFGRTEAKLAELAERDIEASGSGEVAFGDEFEARFTQFVLVARLVSVAILVALFFMVVKP